MIGDNLYSLILHNDSKTNYAYVIACLIKFCKHEPIQAEQCAVIAHNNNKCVIKNGTFNDINLLNEQLTHLDLKVTTNEFKSNMY